MDMEELRILDPVGEFSRANAETAAELQECTVLLQLQALRETVMGFNDRVESFELVSRFNLGSTANIYIEVCNNYSSRGPILIISQSGTEAQEREDSRRKKEEEEKERRKKRRRGGRREGEEEGEWGEKKEGGGGKWRGRGRRGRRGGGGGGGTRNYIFRLYLYLFI